MEELIEAQRLLDKVDASISLERGETGVRIREINNRLVRIYDSSPRSAEMEIMQASQCLEEAEAGLNDLNTAVMAVETATAAADEENMVMLMKEGLKAFEDQDNIALLNTSASKENDKPTNRQIHSPRVVNGDDIGGDVAVSVIDHVEVTIEMQEQEEDGEGIEKGEEDGDKDNEDVLVNKSDVGVDVIVGEETMDLAIEEPTEKGKEKEMEKEIEVSPAKEKRVKKDPSFLHMATWPDFLRNENRSFNFHFPFRLMDPRYRDNSKYQVIIYWNRTSLRLQDNLALQLCLKVHRETELPLLVVNMVNEWDYMIMNEMGTSLQKESQLYAPRIPPVEKVLKHTGVWWSKQRKTLMRVKLLHSLSQELTSRGIATYTLIQKGEAEEQTMSTFLSDLNHYSQKVKKRGKLDVLATFTDDLHNPYDRHMMETMTEENVGCLSDAAMFSVDSNSVYIPRKDNNNNANENVLPMDYEEYSSQYQQHFAQMSIKDKTSEWNFTNIGGNGDKYDKGDEETTSLHEEPIPLASIHNTAKCSVVTGEDWQMFITVFQWYDSLMKETNTSLRARPFDMAAFRWKRGNEHQLMESVLSPPFEPFSFLMSDVEMLLQLGMISPVAVAILVRSVTGTNDGSAHDSITSPSQQYVHSLMQQLCQMDYARHVSRTHILNIRNRRREETKKLRAQAAADSALAININLVIPLQEVPWMDLFCDFLKDKVCEAEYISKDHFDAQMCPFLNATMNEAYRYLYLNDTNNKMSSSTEKRVKRYDTLFSKELCEGKSADVLFNALQRCLIEYGTTAKGLALQYWTGYYLCHCHSVQEGLTMALMEATRHSLVSSGEMASIIVPVLVAAASFVCKELTFYHTNNDLHGSDNLFNSIATELKVMLGDRGEDTKLMRFTQTFVTKTK